MPLQPPAINTTRIKIKARDWPEIESLSLVEVSAPAALDFSVVCVCTRLVNSTRIVLVSGLSIVLLVSIRSLSMRTKQSNILPELVIVEILINKFYVLIFVGDTNHAVSE